jgi:hypothetical protein
VGRIFGFYFHYKTDEKLTVMFSTKTVRAETWWEEVEAQRVFEIAKRFRNLKLCLFNELTAGFLAKGISGKYA